MLYKTEYSSNILWIFQKSCTTWDVLNPVNNGINSMNHGRSISLVVDTVDGSEILPSNRLRLLAYPFIYQGLIDLRQ